MPTDHDIGYSEYTPAKLDHLGAILRAHIAITNAVICKHGYARLYWYIDATAGCGKCPGDGRSGSPFVFLESMNGQLPYCADFIERNPGNCGELNLAIPASARPSVAVHNGDYNEVIPNLLKTRTAMFGLVFVDPSGDLPNFDTLGLLARKRPKLEILIYVSAANIKRTLYLTGTRLSDYCAKIPKRFWLVREPMGKHQWTFLLGSNTDIIKDIRYIGFYRLDSEHGRAIFDVLDSTNQERDERKKKTQLSLPLIEPTPNTCVIPDSAPLGLKP